MKTKKSILLFAIMTMFLYSCNGQKPSEDKNAQAISNEVQVYYFHFTSRCATCTAVENETKIALEMYYKDKINEGVIEFTSLNLDDDDVKGIAESLHVSGQSLLIVKGDTQVNLTNEGFLNARTNPEKFHEIIRTQIDKLL
jgi:hypothetical protein